MGDLNPHLTKVPWAHLSPQPKRHVDGSVVFAQLTAERPYTLQWGALSPFKTAPSQAGSETHIIQDSLGPFESIIQTAYQLVQPFFVQLTAECHYTL